MQAIYKYPIRSGGDEMHLPLNAQILSAKVQRSKIVVYAIVDINEKITEPYEVLELVTGIFINDRDINTDSYTYLETFVNDGGFVTHLFYRKVDQGIFAPLSTPISVCTMCKKNEGIHSIQGYVNNYLLCDECFGEEVGEEEGQ